MYFLKKGICSVQWSLGQSPGSWGICENFCITVCKVTFNCTEKKLGEQDVMAAPPAPLVPTSMTQ